MLLASCSSQSAASHMLLQIGPSLFIADPQRNRQLFFGTTHSFHFLAVDLCLCVFSIFCTLYTMRWRRCELSELGRKYYYYYYDTVPEEEKENEGWHGHLLAFSTFLLAPSFSFCQCSRVLLVFLLGHKFYFIFAILFRSLWAVVSEVHCTAHLQALMLLRAGCR